jgi:hypothetical protein
MIRSLLDPVYANKLYRDSRRYPGSGYSISYANVESGRDPVGIREASIPGPGQDRLLQCGHPPAVF